MLHSTGAFVALQNGIQGTQILGQEFEFHEVSFCLASGSSAGFLGVIAKYRVCVTLIPRSTYSTKLNLEY